MGTALGIAVIRNDGVERSIGDGLFAKTLLVQGTQLYVGTLDPGMYEIPIGRRQTPFRRDAVTGSQGV